jgi:hypothetical protein
MRKLTQEELDEKLRLHQLWLDSKGSVGKKLHIEYMDCSNLDFREVNLQSTFLRGADLTNANLYNVNLQDRCAKGVIFNNTNLHRANIFKLAIYELWKGKPTIVGNVLVLKCDESCVWNDILEWIEITDDNEELFKELYL